MKMFRETVDAWLIVTAFLFYVTTFGLIPGILTAVIIFFLLTTATLLNNQ